jgi:hypothetical protein
MFLAMPIGLAFLFVLNPFPVFPRINFWRANAKRITNDEYEND